MSDPAPPSFSDVVLAFRQAKKAIASERGAVGLLSLAEFETQLASRVRRIRKAMRNEAWFDQVDIGRLMVMPKSAESVVKEKAEIVRIGDAAPARMNMSVRLQLEPTPDFAVVEVLYLWEFGGVLEALLSDSCVGYRLKGTRRDGAMDRSGRDVYEHWPTAFARYRDEPIKAARQALRAGHHVVITSTDVVSFFDSLHADFLLAPAFVDSLAVAAKARGLAFSRSRFVVATRSLLAKYQEFRLMRRKVGGASIDVDVGVPIGSLVSRVFANVALASLDAHVEGLPNILLYRRYVDDIVIVSKQDAGSPTGRTKAQILGALFPGFVADATSERFVVPQTLASFELKESKTRIHELVGDAGVDFLATVQESFSVVVSERRAFFGDVDRLALSMEGVDLFGEGAAGIDRIPRLRDADRFTLRRFMATAFIRGLERCAVLLEREAASSFLHARTRRMLSVLDGSFLVEDFELVLSLLKVALLCRCKEVVDELLAWLARRTGEEMVAHLEAISWRGTTLPKQVAATAMLVFLKRRIRESVATACEFYAEGSARSERRTIQDAVLLRRTDLRHLDREDDAAVFGRLPRGLPPRFNIEQASALRALNLDEAMRERLARIVDFMKQSERLGELIWRGSSEIGLLLSVRPPRYSDVARRFLARAEITPLPPDVGKRIDDCVDALRGTRYGRRRTPAFSVVRGGDSVRLEVATKEEPGVVRVVLANLPVPLSAFHAAASGQPSLSLERLRTLDRVLRDARRAASQARRKGFAVILVFPELAIPGRWARDLAEYAVEEDLSLVAGVEYVHTSKGLVNQAMGVFPAGRHTAAIVRWTKRNPAHNEGKALGKAFRRLNPSAPRLVVESAHGRLGVLICSEILEANALSALRGRMELLLVPAWNDDTSSFDHVSHAAAGLLVHSFVCVANNAEASDSRIVAPVKEPRWAREWCRLVHRGEPQVIWGDLPIAELRALHDAGPPDGPVSSTTKVHSSTRTYRPLPPGWRSK